VGEHFAAYILEAHGIEAQRVDTQYADLWCRVGESLVAVEVKTSSAPVKRGARSLATSYRYNLRAKKHGWFCFVALDIRCVLLCPVEELDQLSSFSIKASLFTADAQRNSIEHFLKNC
jgi:hypothetical protein